MPRGRGKAERVVGNPFWNIVNPSGARLSRFDHDRFSHIANGARVQYVDDDEDGISEYVQSVADVERMVGLAASGGHRFGRGARLLLSHHVVVNLSEAPDASADMEALMVAVSNRASESHTPVTLEMLREHGVTA